jgi:hypothetical protein
MGKLIKGAKNVFDYFKGLRAGERVSRDTLLGYAGWQEGTLKTYISKRKLDYVLQEENDGSLVAVRNGDELIEEEFHKEFTQKRVGEE